VVVATDRRSKASVLTDEMEGSVDGIKYRSEDSGYAVFDLLLAGKGHKWITCNGVMPDIKQGMKVTIVGEWLNHPKFGKQFRFTTYRSHQPSGEAEAIGYLQTLRCVNAAIAAAMYEKWGDGVFSVIEETPDLLKEVKGIGAKNLPKIIEDYLNTNRLRTLIAFLHSIEVSVSYAKQLDADLGGAAIPTIKRDPYQLTGTVKGFGFKRADEIARKFGTAPDAAHRINAGVFHTHSEMTNFSGHCFVLADELRRAAIATITLPEYRPTDDEINRAIGRLILPSQKKGKRLTVEGQAVYRHAIYEAECELADRLRLSAGTFANIADEAWGKWLEEYETSSGMTLADGQKQAVYTAIGHSISVVTGGAGVGKTATTKAVIDWWSKQGYRITACAPTGKAAQRIKELTGIENSSTIHRLLGWGGGGQYAYNAKRPIEADAVLVDEASMMDISLANSLFQAIPPSARVLLVGDINQLPSVGPGNVLRDVIDSGICPVTRLTQIFRQGAGSNIVNCSHQINNGDFPQFETLTLEDDAKTDALWFPCQRHEILGTIEAVIKRWLPSRGYDLNDVQMLSPQHKTEVGNIALNQLAQQLWNPIACTRKAFGFFRVNDRVIQTKNDYQLTIFNGDIGKIKSANIEDKIMDIDFGDAKPINYPGSPLDNLQLAYSISVHKSQGSEFPIVIIPATMSHYMVLQRNLLYTAVTRAKRLLIVVGEKEAIAQAVRVQGNNKRQTRLLERIGLPKPKNLPSLDLAGSGIVDDVSWEFEITMSDRTLPY
jgi:exodeoxyribonuclease V alpha subunit